jgi:tetratricopeptide (TPR) repeat protein
MSTARELFDAALLAQQAGQLDQAISGYEEVLAIAPDDLPARANRALALAQLGRHEAASIGFAEALALQPNDPALRQNLVVTALNAGTSLLDQGQPAAAADAFRRAVAAAPDHAAAQGSLGLALAQLGELDAAIDALRAALALAPDDAGLRYNLGNALREQGRLDEALDAYRAALAVQPDFIEALCQVGSLERLRSAPHEALIAFEAAAAVDPRSAMAQLGLGGALHDLGRLSEAVSAFRRAQALDPADGEAQRSEALSLLLQGDYARGWEMFEWRWRTKDMTLRRLDANPWRGEQLAGRTILLYAEQGLGDTIQFARFVPDVAARGGRVILQAQRPLLGLLESLDGVDRLIAARQAPPAFDVQAPLLSLPWILGTRLETIPARAPYLAADPAQAARWAARIGAGAGRAIGLVWAGNPRHLRDRVRSLPAPRLAPLLRHDARWFSLQVGASADARALPPGPITDLAPELADFSATAAAIAALDLVIAVDTAVAHLAGALGKTVWLMLPFSPDYRWLLGRGDSPWYPTMRLFRQPSPGDWDTVVAQVGAALNEPAPSS